MPQLLIGFTFIIALITSVSYLAYAALTGNRSLWESPEEVARRAVREGKPSLIRANLRPGLASLTLPAFSAYLLLGLFASSLAYGVVNRALPSLARLPDRLKVNYNPAQYLADVPMPQVLIDQKSVPNVGRPDNPAAPQFSGSLAAPSGVSLGAQAQGLLDREMGNRKFDPSAKIKELKAILPQEKR